MLEQRNNRGKLMNATPDKVFEDFLAQQLQQTREYLPDDGFTARVMGSLPAAAPQGLSGIMERLIAGIPVLLIAALVLSQFPWGRTITNVWYVAAHLDVSQWFTFALSAAASLLVASVFWFWQTEESF
jgi:hypothetical protein